MITRGNIDIENCSYKHYYDEYNVIGTFEKKSIALKTKYNSLINNTEYNGYDPKRLRNIILDKELETKVISL